MSSIALRLAARPRLVTHRIRTLTLRRPWFADLAACTDPAVSRPARGAAGTRFATAALAAALLGGTLSGAATAVADQLGERSVPRFLERTPPPLAAPVEATGSATEAKPAPTPATTAKPPPPPAAPPAHRPVASSPPARTLPLPAGKGMWLWQPEAVEGADPHAIVARALGHDLTHLFVRTGSSWQGFHGADFLNRLLPVAHDSGLRVYGWDFPKLADPGVDLARAVTAIRHTAPGGHRIDGFVPDIETWSEGTHLTRERVQQYGHGLRAAVGPDYPLVVAVPRPSAQKLAQFDYALVLEPYDAVAPMVYWLNRQPDSDVVSTMNELARFGKPILPVGQAYDGAPEGGRPGPPPAHEIRRFMQTAERHGAVSVSFWSWQHADQEIWSAIRDAPEFRLRNAHPGKLRPGEVRAIHHLIRGLGYQAPAGARWSDRTARALKQFQRDAGLPVTGRFNGVTRRLMLRPVVQPIPAR